MRKKGKEKRVRRLILMCSFCLLFLMGSTYAWFIGMKTVNVTSFDVKISGTEGLYLSMNGTDWKYELNPMTDTAYAGNHELLFISLSVPSLLGEEKALRLQTKGRC